MSPIEVKPAPQVLRPPEPSLVRSGRACLDTSGNPRIPILMEMVGELSRASDPKEVLAAFSRGMTRIHGPRGYVSISTRGLKPGEYKITRLLNSRAQHMAAADPWRDWNRLPVHRGGFFGEIIRNAYPEVIHHLYLKDDPVVGDALAAYGSLMAIPLFENGEPLNWAITLQEDPEGFTVQDLEEAILRSNLGGATVRNVMIAKQLREANDKIRHEMEQIARIQRALLPQSLPKFPGLTIATSYDTFDTAGGDFYDFTVLEPPDDGPTQFDGCLAMLIADAAGHGPAAAVLTAMLNSLLYAYPRRGDGPGHAFEFANKHLFSKKLDGMFVTAFLAVYDPRDHRLVYARAGHNPPLIKALGSGAPVRRLDDVGGIPLGILDDVAYESRAGALPPGHTLVMYTDGITEAMNRAGEMFGVAGIERALHECSGEPACVVNSIITALREHEGGVRPSDDQTIVAVKVE